MERFVDHGIDIVPSPQKQQEVFHSRIITFSRENSPRIGTPLETIRCEYPDQWVAVEKTVMNGAFQCIEGRVIAATDNIHQLQEAVGVLAKLPQNQNLNLAFIFTGSRI